MPAGYTKFITAGRGKRSGEPCIRGVRITVGDVLEYLASGMSDIRLLADFPYLIDEDIEACRAFDTNRENTGEH